MVIKDFEIKLPDGVDVERILNYKHNLKWYESFFYWCINWIKPTETVRLNRWIKSHLELSDNLQDKIDYIHSLSTNKKKIREIVKFVNKYIIYKTDLKIWNLKEKWQTPTETWTERIVDGKLGRYGDCEDGALLIYAIAKYIGIPDYQLYIVAGEVKGGGHCYVVYVSDKNALEYPIDWCYWYRSSYNMNTPYVKIKNYFYGDEEWFRFNALKTYKRRRK